MDGTLQRYKCHKISFSKTVHKTSLKYKCTQNQFTVQVYTKLVYWLIMNGMYMDRTLQRYKFHTISFSTTVHKTSLLYTIQVYTKLV